MKLILFKLCVIIIVTGLVLSGCKTYKKTNKTQRGAVIGATAGAGLGAAVAGKNRALGAILGAVVGGVAGGLIGRKMDKQAEEIKETLPGAEVVRSEEGIQVILDEASDVRFKYNKFNLTPKAEENLQKLVNIFTKYPDTNILIVGHTDSKGTDEYNQTLSEKRADTVNGYLIDQGLNSSRITALGLGETQPRYTNETVEGRAGNRRVEFAITANEKMVEDAKKEAGE